MFFMKSDVAIQFSYITPFLESMSMLVVVSSILASLFTLQSLYTVSGLYYVTANGKRTCYCGFTLNVKHKVLFFFIVTRLRETHCMCNNVSILVTENSTDSDHQIFHLQN